MHTGQRSASIAALLLTLLSHQIGTALPQVGGPSGIGSISGRVLGPDGTPASNLRIFLIPAPPEGVADRNEPIVAVSLTQTGGDGKYVLSDVPLGQYFIVTGPFDEPVYLGRVSVGPPGKQTVSDLRLLSPLSYVVRGHIRGAFVPGDRVVLSRGPRYQDLETRIARDGSFEFLAVRPGTYAVYVQPLPFTLPPVQVMADHDVVDLEITIPRAPITGVEVIVTASVEGGGLLPRIMIPFPTVEQIRESDDSSAPVEIPNPYSTPIYWLKSPQRTAPHMGRFAGVIDTAFPLSSFAIPEGDYSLLAASVRLPQGYSLKSVRSGSFDLLKSPLTVNGSGAPPIEVTLAVSSPPPWVRVEGRMIELEKLGAKPTQIFIENEQLSLPLTSNVEPDGRFEFPMALPGTYHVTLVPSTDDFDRTMTIRGSGVVRIEMPSTPALMRIRGRVEGAMPEPNVSAEAWLHRDPPVKVIGPNGRLVEDAPIAPVRADGSFEFGDVVGRNYRMFLRFCPTAVSASPGEMTRSSEFPVTTPGCSTFYAAEVTVKDAERPIIVDSASLFSMDEQIRRFSGRLTVDGKPVALRIAARLEPAARPSGSSVGDPQRINFQSAADGTFSFSTYDGEYDVTLQLPLGASIKSFAKGPTDLLKQPLRLTWANRDDLTLQLVVNRMNFAAVSGRVIGIDSTRLPVTVILTGGSFSESIEAPLNTDGSFSIFGVATGRYEIELGGSIHRKVSGNLLVAEMMHADPRKAVDVTGLEIIVPDTRDRPPVLRIPQ